MKVIAESGVSYAYDGETEYCCSNPAHGHERECKVGHLLRVVGGAEEAGRQAEAAWDEALLEASRRWCPKRRPLATTTTTQISEMLRAVYSPELLSGVEFGPEPRLVGLDAWLPQTEPGEFFGTDRSAPIPEGRPFHIEPLPQPLLGRTQLIYDLRERGLINVTQARLLLGETGPGPGASIDYSSARGPT
jgi:hypothetical protein